MKVIEIKKPIFAVTRHPEENIPNGFKAVSIESQEAIFDCRPQSFMIPENDYYDHPDRYLDNYEERINRGEMNIRRYVEYFPNKFPCFVNAASDEKPGYFDLFENKFVPALDL